MTMMIREPEYVVLKQHRAEHVTKLIAGMSLSEQLAFWQKRTEAMLNRQKKINSKTDSCLICRSKQRNSSVGEKFNQESNWYPTIEKNFG